MQRKVTLAKGAFLWEEGDHARNIAVLDQGKLGVRSGGTLIGIIYPRMVLGEGAVLTLEGEAHPRTASVMALEDDTVITEYPAGMVKQALDLGKNEVGTRILNTLLGQTSRNCLLMMHAHRDRPIVAGPVRGLLQGLAECVKEVPRISNWKEFLVAFRFLFRLRDDSAAMRSMLSPRVDADDLLKASELVKQMFAGHDIASLLDDFISAEKEKDEWLTRGS